jgi:hypothetical protein
MHFATFFIATLASGASATVLQSRNVESSAVTDPDAWDFFHYEGIRTGGSLPWEGGSSKLKQIKAAHYEAVTPTLPDGIKIPNPFLPSSDPQLLALYTLAINHFEVEERKGLTEKMADMAEKKKDMAQFSQMNICVHDKPFCPDSNMLKKTKDYKKYEAEYTKLFEKLKQQTLVAGLVDLGGKLKASMAETGLKIEMS